MRVTRPGEDAGRNDDFITFDAKLAYEADRWSVALIGKNLADARYFQPFAEGLGMVAPGEPRTVYVVATVKY